MPEIDVEVLEAHISALAFRAVGGRPHEAQWLKEQSYRLTAPRSTAEAMAQYDILEDLLWQHRAAIAAENTEDN